MSPPEEGGRTPRYDTETLLRRVIDVIASAKTMPLSSSAMLPNRDEVLQLLDEAVARLPEELRSARWLLREREEFLAKTRREADAIVEMGRQQAERMVARTEVVRQAERKARELLDSAEEESRRLRHEAEDFCDQKLASFELVLDRTRRVVQAGREKLAVSPLALVTEEPPAEEAGEPGVEFFDQDQD